MVGLPDPRKYSDSDLHDAYANVNQKQLPGRAQMLRDEIERRQRLGIKVPDDEREHSASAGGAPELELLYAYGAAGNLNTVAFPVPVDSEFHGKLAAVRWRDSTQVPSQGAVQWFGFPLYYMEDSEAQAVIDASLDWFFDNRVIPVK